MARFLKSDKVIELIHQYRDNGSVKAIVVRIDSPGGSVAPVQEIYGELNKLEKPVVASLGGTAASGGYYIACAADQIFANPGTLTGSIGVIMQFLKMKGLYDKVGIGSANCEERSSLKTQDHQFEISHRQRGSCCRIRSTMCTINLLTQYLRNGQDRLTRDEVQALADGRIFSGNQALEHKLVDRLGNLSDAITHAAELGGIVGKPKGNACQARTYFAGTT